MANWNLLDLGQASNAYNSAWSGLNQSINNFSKQLQKNTANAEASQERSNEFNAWQAQLNRDFQAKMSSTAHQREVADLKAAGLSPVLSASAGASTPSGSSAQSSDNLTSMYANLAMASMSAMSNMTQTIGNMGTELVKSANQANIQKYSTELGAEVNVFASKLQSLTQQEVAHIAGRYGVDQATIHMYATKYAAEVARDASNFAAQMGYNASWNQVQAQIRNTDANNLTSYRIARMNNDTSSLNTDKQAIVSLIGHVLGLVPG